MIKAAVTSTSLVVLVMLAVSVAADTNRLADTHSVAQAKVDKTSLSQNDARSGNAAKKARIAAGFTPEREAAAMMFVQQHHVELAKLLVNLKRKVDKGRSSAIEYQTVIHDLFQTSERLARIQARDVEQYELELKLWQAISRSELFSVRLKLHDTKKNREQLEKVLGERYDLELQLLQHDKRKLTDRLARIENSIEKLQQGRQSRIDRQIRLLLRKKGKDTSRNKATVPAEKQSKPLKAGGKETVKPT